MSNIMLLHRPISVIRPKTST